MIEFSKELEERAKKLAETMTGDDLVALPVGEKEEALWLSLNPEILVPLYHVDREDGSTIHIGLKKEVV